ncbi:MAG: Holliday junction branch migration protein RuvA [Candidatus Acetothermia bacterium]|jgi:Holliday junction DNA helicase RuvA|nr:Holliday junction branch migration protein RuvA [Candidatus Acetothermia bacterium]MDH7505788.1 Holliday junction branch migration protein RuvA [Candidatus Acetothermia bacterium]
MIDTITGELVELGEGYAVVEANGIGYRVFITKAARADLAQADGPVRLFTQLQWREDGLELYGFVRAEEREIFRLLLGVAGVGPRLALQVLSAMAPAQFCRAVINKQAEELQRIKGVGRKTADRLILELRDKLAKFALAEEGGPVFSEREELAFRALRSLGFTATEARRAVERAQVAGEDLSTEELIKRALELVRT